MRHSGCATPGSYAMQMQATQNARAWSKRRWMSSWARVRFLVFRPNVAALRTHPNTFVCVA